MCIPFTAATDSADRGWDGGAKDLGLVSLAQDLVDVQGCLIVWQGEKAVRAMRCTACRNPFAVACRNEPMLKPSPMERI
jgi:hypothetical protein